jgi:putative ubiquitin-RnfH superfamily antitoxin RatB of RatAB toxin-antitoxin module
MDHAEATESVSVLFALPDDQTIVKIRFETGMTATQAVERSGLLERYPEIGSADLVLGIWGMAVPGDCGLKPGDRVEISRPLVADPRDMRRTLMSDGRVMGGALARVDPIRKEE